MSFLKKVQKKIVAKDGPANGLPSGANHPQNWVSNLESGKTAYDHKKDADKLNKMLTELQKHSLELQHVYDCLMKNGGKNFEMNSPHILKGLSRERLLMLCSVLEKIAEQAPTV